VKAAEALRLTDAITADDLRSWRCAEQARNRHEEEVSRSSGT
jgi:hypothetical protein